MATRSSRIAVATRPTARARTRQKNQPRSLRGRLKNFFALLFLLGEVALAVALVSGLFIFWNFSRELPNLQGLITDIRPPVPTTIWTQDGVLLGKLEVENRIPVKLDQIAKVAREATVAIEDHRFYEHRGVDLQGIARSVVANISEGGYRQGGSTLTQQLVRNINQLGVNPFGISKEKVFRRKVREALIAVRMEQLYKKDEILELYLNNIYYGTGAYGIEAASRTYFDKSASKLTLAEAAFLAGLAQSPSRYAPYRNKKAALNRRNEVLARMLEYGYIKQDQYEKASHAPSYLQPRKEQKHEDFKAPYFTNYVLAALFEKYEESFVRSGLRVETTLNWKMQQKAEETLLNGLSRTSGYGANQGALVSLDQRTGYIRAMVGGRSFKADQFNAVTQGRRQPGSTFKAFVYAAAFETGISLSKTYPDREFPYPGDPKHRVVRNYGGGASGAYLSCRSAIMYSKNTIAVRVAEDIGISKVIACAKKLGIGTDLDPYLSTALGASAVRPLELCSAYSVFANDGNRCPPMAIVRIKDADDNVVEEHIPQMEKGLLKESTVAQMNEALQAVVMGGTGTKARGYEGNGLIENAHGKTGTTNDSRDAWFAGYTPELTTVIWVANVQRGAKKRLVYASMPGATGGALCAPIWHDFMVFAIPEQRKFKPLQPITVSTSTTESKSEEKQKEKRAQEEADKAKDQGAGEAIQRPTDADKAEPSEPDSDLISPADRDANPPGEDQNNRIAVPPSEANNTKPREEEPTPLPSPPVTRPTARAEPPEMTNVRVCIDSNSLANDYCPATTSRLVPASQARKMSRCRRHKPPPGEG